MRLLAPAATLDAQFAVESGKPKPWPLTAYDRRFFELRPPKLQDRGRFPSDRAAFAAVLNDPRLIITDPGFLQPAGGQRRAFAAKIGRRITIIDPYSGARRQVMVAAIAPPDYFRNGALYGLPGARALFGSRLVDNRAFIALARVSPTGFAKQLSATYVANGAEADATAKLAGDALSEQVQFYRLIRAYLALGLIIGVAGLAVAMVRAVRERRQVIGMLRAVGCDAATVGASFVLESAFVALEATAIGLTLALVTTYSLLTNSEALGTQLAFTIPLLPLALILAATILVSLLATAAPARTAVRIRPAIALRAVE